MVKKNLAPKKPNLPSESLDNFACCDAAVFELHNFFIFLSFIENIGSYDSLLLHCGGGGRQYREFKFVGKLALCWSDRYSKISLPEVKGLAKDFSEFQNFFTIKTDEDKNEI